MPSVDRTADSCVSRGRLPPPPPLCAASIDSPAVEVLGRGARTRQSVRTGLAVNVVAASAGDDVTGGSRSATQRELPRVRASTLSLLLVLVAVLPGCSVGNAPTAASAGGPPHEAATAGGRERTAVAAQASASPTPRPSPVR